jgi:hypothetical protein
MKPTLLAFVVLLVVNPSWAQSRDQQSQLRVTVMDQTEASIPTATVRVTQTAGAPLDAVSDERGQTTFSGLKPGTAQLRVEAPGFAPYDAPITLRRGSNSQTITLKLASLAEDVIVTETDADERRDGTFTTTLTDEDIAALPDDPDELQAALEEMTGGAGAVFFVDGFRGGRLPPKSEIRQIRFRRNSFSADNHDAGRVQVEIITRPGLTTWSGNANFGFRGDVMNARNAFALRQTPEQFRRFNAGFRGPLKKNTTSLRFNAEGNRSFDSATIVAQLPDLRFTDQVRHPIDQTNFTAGLEHALAKNQTLRIDYRRSDDERRNLGAGNFNLLDRAYTRTRDENQVRASLQSVMGRSGLNQLRVQFNTQYVATHALSGAPTVVVIDAFSSGGAGVASDQQSRMLEVTDDADFKVGRHEMRAGLLLETGSYRQEDGRNAAGTFTFGSLESFLAGRPNTFTQRLGDVETSFSQYQLGLYWQDDVRINRVLSLNLGIREELQSHVSDVWNVMPRFGFTLTPRGWKTTLRGGYGIFHDWYDSDLYDQTLRVNGIAQRDLLILNPGYPDPFTAASAVILPGGRVQSSPSLLLPYVHQASIGAERSFSQSFMVQAVYSWQRGYSQLRSRNINAPDPFGVRPQPDIGTISQIESTGRTASDRLMLNANYRVPRRRILLGFNYTLSNVKNHTDSPLQLPASSLDPDAEWGPSSQDVRHRLFAMLNVPLMAGIRANVTSQASSPVPYTMTTGRDDNGDGVSNDRPVGVARNSERTASRWDMNIRFSRGFGFGGDRTGRGGPDGPTGGPGGGPVIIAGPGGGQGGGPGGGGPGGGGVFFGPGATNERFNLEFYVQAYNVLNRTNFINFSGNLQSPFFGMPTSAGPARRIELGMQFRF